MNNPPSPPTGPAPAPPSPSTPPPRLYDPAVLRRRRVRALFRRRAWTLLVSLAGAVKRGADIVISLSMLLLSLPVFVGIGLLVRLDGGPIFFRQVRIGRFGRPFKMLKFRSMCVDAEERLAALLAENDKEQGITFKMKHDPRVTRVGHWLRRTSLDELPQLINVLQGDMSMVGPRPPVIREVELYSPSDRHRLHAKPGITCLWQIGEREGRWWEVGDRNEIDFEEQVSLDLRYIERQGFWRDLWILVKTLPAVLFGK